MPALLNVRTVPLGVPVVERGLPTEATVAHVLVSRYADHLPLYRQAGILARQGILVDRATLAVWVGTGAAEIVPVVRRMRTPLRASARLFADETSVPVLDPGRGKTKTGWFWTIARADRPWSGADPPAVVCTYAPGRGRSPSVGILPPHAAGSRPRGAHPVGGRHRRQPAGLVRQGHQRRPSLSQGRAQREVVSVSRIEARSASV